MSVILVEQMCETKRVLERALCVCESREPSVWSLPLCVSVAQKIIFIFIYKKKRKREFFLMSVRAYKRRKLSPSEWGIQTRDKIPHNISRSSRGIHLEPQDGSQGS